MHGFEFKYASTPKPTRSMHVAVEDLGLDGITIVYPGEEAYALTERIRVASPGHLAQQARFA